MSKPPTELSLFEKARVNNGITRVQLANKAGISDKTLYRMERGRRTLAPVSIARAVMALSSLAGSSFRIEDLFSPTGKPK